jgi:hypothetical protein
VVNLKIQKCYRINLFYDWIYWTKLNKTVIFSFFPISHIKSALQKCRQFCSMVKFVEKIEQNSDFALFFKWDPKARLRFEILFKKFHPRINMTTLFLTIMYLLNTMKPFSSHANRSMTKSQKPLQGGSEYIVLFSDPKLLNKSAVRFVLWWNSLNKFFISPFWVEICMGGTLRTPGAKISAL